MQPHAHGDLYPFHFMVSEPWKSFLGAFVEMAMFPREDVVTYEIKKGCNVSCNI